MLFCSSRGITLEHCAYKTHNGFGKVAVSGRIGGKPKQFAGVLSSQAQKHLANHPHHPQPEKAIETYTR